MQSRLLPSGINWMRLRVLILVIATCNIQQVVIAKKGKIAPRVTSSSVDGLQTTEQTVSTSSIGDESPSTGTNIMTSQITNEITTLPSSILSSVNTADGTFSTSVNTLNLFETSSQLMINETNVASATTLSPDLQTNNNTATPTSDILIASTPVTSIMENTPQQSVTTSSIVPTSTQLLTDPTAQSTTHAKSQLSLTTSFQPTTYTADQSTSSVDSSTWSTYSTSSVSSTTTELTGSETTTQNDQSSSTTTSSASKADARSGDSDKWFGLSGPTWLIIGICTGLGIVAFIAVMCRLCPWIVGGKNKKRKISPPGSATQKQAWPDNNKNTGTFTDGPEPVLSNTFVPIPPAIPVTAKLMSKFKRFKNLKVTDGDRVFVQKHIESLKNVTPRKTNAVPTKLSQS